MVQRDRSLELLGGDPFAFVMERAESHRTEHVDEGGAECGLYPAGPGVMRHAGAVARASRAKRILDLGAGIGYSALWLAHSTAPDARIDAVDQHAWHADLAREMIAATPYAARIRFHTSRAREFLEAVREPYDFIQDDAWFAFQPDYYEDLIAALAPGGTWSLPNWFLLEDALTGEPRRDWSEFVGPDWPRAIVEYATALVADSRLVVSWSFNPPLALAVKR